MNPHLSMMRPLKSKHFKKMRVQITKLVNNNKNRYSNNLINHINRLKHNIICNSKINLHPHNLIFKLNKDLPNHNNSFINNRF